MSQRPAHDPEIVSVADWLRDNDPDGVRTSKVLRATFDQLYDGQHTGRYRWDQLYKTEKTHCGTLVEINLHREFAFEDGAKLDYRIAGIEVDCKYSQAIGGWMIPPEARGHICLVLSAEDDARPIWSLGLVRATGAHLNAGTNRDAKSTLNTAGRASILWLFRDHPMPANVLLQLDKDVVGEILGHRSGQQRINRLFITACGLIVGRAAVATVAKQDDYMKRLRQNGGARSALRHQGIVILGQYRNHARIAGSLGLPVPGPGESISARITPADRPAPGVARIGGALWRLAKPGDPVGPAPVLPRV